MHDSANPKRKKHKRCQRNDVQVKTPNSDGLKSGLSFSSFKPPMQRPNDRPNDNGRPRESFEIVRAENLPQHGHRSNHHECQSDTQHEIQIYLPKFRLDFNWDS